MTVARSIAEVLTGRVTLEIESIDRMYLNLYVPGLQYTGGVASFFQAHRGHPFASSALMDPISKDFIAGFHRMCRDLDVPMIDFVKGQRKDDVALEHLAEFTGQEGVLFVGRAQEKTRVFRTEKRRNPETGATYPWIVSGTGVVNHFYVYAVDGAVLPQVLHLLPVQRQVVHQRQRVRQAAGGQGRDRVHRPGQRVRRLRGPAPVAGHL